MFAAPSMSLNVMLVPLYITLPQFYTVEVGMNVAVIANVFLVARLWDAVTDPTIGSLSDRIHTRWGRRRPWMVAGMPFAILATWFLLNPPSDATYLYPLVWVFGFYFFWTMMFIPYQSWGTELATDFNERNRVAGYRDGASFLGYLLASLLPLLILQVAMGIDEPTFRQMIMVLAGFFFVSLPIGILVCFWAVCEPPRRESEQIRWVDLFAIVVRNKPFRRLLFAYLLDRSAMGTYFFVMPTLVISVLGVFEFFLTFALVISIASLLFTPLWVMVANRWGKHPAYCAANVVTCLAYAMFLLVPPGSFAWTLPIFIVLGAGNAGTLITAPSMMADCVDYDHLKSGVEQTGAHMAFLWLVTKIGFALGIAIGGNFLALYGFDASAADNSAEALSAVRVATGGLPIMLLIPAILLMVFFPLNRHRHAVIRRRLESRSGVGQA